MSTAAPKRALPVATPETQHYWDGTAVGELRLQRCRSCGDAYFPPQPWCAHCASDEVEVFTASGEATLYSYVISQLPAPGFEAPYAIAVVTLAEGPRMLTNLVGVEAAPDALPLDLPLVVEFENVGDVTLPVFRPAS
jgi:uncharacterized OB-fold protein